MQLHRVERANGLRNVAGWVGLCFAMAVLLSSSSATAMRQTARPERFSAIAVLTTEAGSPTPIDIFVERWSTDDENERVITGLKELGTKGMLQALLKLKPIGSIATTGSAGYPLRYAWKVTGPDGVERITMATDRPVGFWEASNQVRALDYPLTIIELRLKPGPSGSGTGQIAIAAQMHFDRMLNGIVLENYGLQPVPLSAVKRVR
jgi:hypothetical protein